jgi:hypothetical protein
MLKKLSNINWTKNMFLVPILLVAGISISHVVSWYDMANPINWAIYLSIAIEIGAMTSLIAATKKIKGGVWFMFGLVTFIQMMGNIFYSYVEIDETGDLFKNWVELTSPLFEMMGTDPTDIIPHKRWLALLEGGLLPLISLTALHFYTKYEDPSEGGETPKHNGPTTPNHNNPTPNDIQYPSDSTWTKWNKPVEGYQPTEPLDTTNPPQGNEPLGKYDLKFGPEFTKVMDELHVGEDEAEIETIVEPVDTRPIGPVEEENPEDEIIIDEVIETKEEENPKEYKEELLPEVKSTQERLYPNTIEDDERRRKVLSDEEGKKTLTYKKRNKITQKIEK